MIHVLAVAEKNTNNVTASDNNFITMIFKKYILLSFFILFGAHLMAQVTIQEEPAITRLMQNYKSKNKQKSVIRAWQIQIMATTNRSEMDAANARFERLYPHIDYAWQHNPPYYQVRVGAFERKEDLEAFLLELKAEFPSATPVQDDIEKTKLLRF